MWRSVDFPAPEGPMMETKSPSSTSMSMRRRSQVRPPAWGTLFSRLRALMRVRANRSLPPQGVGGVHGKGAAERAEAGHRGGGGHRGHHRGQGEGIERAHLEEHGPQGEGEGDGAGHAESEPGGRHSRGLARDEG